MMTEVALRSGIDEAMAQLRNRILQAGGDGFLGNEDALMALLGTSRGTVRQVARILEREGLLQVRRGVNGGYFAVQPDLGSIQVAVSSYLHSVDVRPDDAMMIASVLWVETMRKAAIADIDKKQIIVDQFATRLADLGPMVSFAGILDYEVDFRDAVFELVGSRYVQLIFQINATFAHDNYVGGPALSEAEQTAFLRTWRNAKHLELASIANGDAALATDAGARARMIWDQHLARRNRTK